MAQRDLRAIPRRRTGWDCGVGMGAAPCCGKVAVRGVYEGGGGHSLEHCARHSDVGRRLLPPPFQHFYRGGVSENR